MGRIQARRIDTSELTVAATGEVGVTWDAAPSRSGLVLLARDSADEGFSSPRRLVRVGRDAVATTNVEIGHGAEALAVGHGSVWVTFLDGTLRKYHEGTFAEEGRVQVGAEPDGLAVSDDGVWVAISGDGAVVRVDPDSLDIMELVPVGQLPRSPVVAAGFVWVRDGERTIRISPSGR